MAGPESYEQFDGPPGAAVYSKWLSSGDFPNYDKDVTLLITNVMKGTNLKMDGGVTHPEGIVAFFAPTGPGRPTKQLLLNKGHQKALARMFGKTTDLWRGPIDVFVQKDAYTINRELVDGVKMRDRKPKKRAETPLNEKPNEGGGTGKLGKPKEEEVKEPDATDTFKALSGAVKDAIPVSANMCGKDNGKKEYCHLELSHDGVCSWARDPDTGEPLPPEFT